MATNTEAHEDTIAAIATGNTCSGIGIIRISGSQALVVARKITHQETLPPRQAITSCFFTAQPGQCLQAITTKQKIDFGLVIYFAAPHSFTGEDVIELHGHGNPILLHLLLDECVRLGCRLAQPGDFSRRAFLNNKIDLTQAEATADLIHAQSVQAAHSAFASMQGAFAQTIHQLQEQLTELRVYVEAAIDFPDEDIDFLADSMLPNGMVAQGIRTILKQLQQLGVQAQQSVLLQEGIKIVIAGAPNVGKSSLLNLLTSEETAIISNMAGTTRDPIKSMINIDGLPIQIIDTAGIHTTNHPIEQQGIEKSLAHMQQADLILWLHDGNKEDTETMIQTLLQYALPERTKTILVQNKIDLLSTKKLQKIQYCIKTAIENNAYKHKFSSVAISATQHLGIDPLKHAIRQQTGFIDKIETPFSARQRHVRILSQVQNMIRHAQTQFTETRYGELLAEDLRQAQLALDEITGKHSNDQLLGSIFAGFCIGK